MQLESSHGSEVKNHSKYFKMLHYFKIELQNSYENVH